MPCLCHSGGGCSKRGLPSLAVMPLSNHASASLCWVCLQCGLDVGEVNADVHGEKWPPAMGMGCSLQAARGGPSMMA
jgi:hypothetical protein